MPALQRQSVRAKDAAAELESAGHAVHARSPVSTLYVPALHATHASPVYPGLQTQKEEPAIDILFSVVHSLQSLS